MVSKEEMNMLRERSARYYANLPGANFKKKKKLPSIGTSLTNKAKKHKGFKII